MKKVFMLVVALMLVAVLSASAAYMVKPSAVDSVFHSNADPEVPWHYASSTESDGSFTITETANLDGHTYEIGIVGKDDQVARVYFSGWFADMEMIEGMFPQGLHAYNDCLCTCQDFLPDDMEVDFFFSPYDIYYAVEEVDSYFESSEHWQLIANEPGRLAIRHPEGCEVEARHMDDGRMWFTVTF